MKKNNLLVTLCYLMGGALTAASLGAQATPRIQFEKYKLPNGLEVHRINSMVCA